MLVDIVNDRDRLIDDVEDNWNLLLVIHRVDDDRQLTVFVVDVVVVEYQTVQV